MNTIDVPPLSGIQKWHGKSEVKYLLVMLHGHNSNSEIFSSIGEQFSNYFKNAYVFTPNGSILSGDNRYRWFDTTDTSNGEIKFGINNSCSIVNRSVEYYLDILNLLAKDVFFIGFSEGATIALHSGLTRNDQIGGILSFSGQIVDALNLSKSIKSRPPICMVHGDKDNVTPIEELSSAITFFRNENISFNNHICLGLGHELNREALIHGVQFLSNYMDRELK